MSFTFFDTAIGRCGIAWNDAGLTLVQLPEEDDAATQARLLRKAGEAERTSCPSSPSGADDHPRWVQTTILALRDHLEGRARDFSEVPLDMSRITPFVAKVYRETQAIPSGRTMTYGELASRVGSKAASRAVGRAMATNPWPLIVPCHRVVGAGRTSGGFSAYGGLVTKERLLALEGARLPSNAPPLQQSLFGSVAPRVADRSRIAKSTEATPREG